MNESDQLLKNRFSELAGRAFSRGCYVYSDFLTVSEQDTLCRMVFGKGSAPFTLHGGYETAERRVACFGSEELCGYAELPPIACIEISPLSQKFAEALGHRDFLGSVIALGIKRNVLGDIVVRESRAFLFCLESVAAYIAENLKKVRNTPVDCRTEEAPDLVAELPEPVGVNVASERLDSLVAAVYRLSRGDSQQLIAQKKVFVDSRLAENPSCSPKVGGIISVRGFGRFIYEGVSRETRKGRLVVSVRVF